MVHTPGPFDYDHNAPDEIFGLTAMGEGGCRFTLLCTNKLPPPDLTITLRNPDDMPMLAAAPDLLAACELWLREYDFHNRIEYCQDWEKAAFAQMARAIAKAREG